MPVANDDPHQGDDGGEWEGPNERTANESATKFSFG
jgi:hypothetical protein